MGKLSIRQITVPHTGHADARVVTEPPDGRLFATTLMKLATHAP